MISNKCLTLCWPVANLNGVYLEFRTDFNEYLEQLPGKLERQMGTTEWKKEVHQGYCQSAECNTTVATLGCGAPICTMEHPYKQEELVPAEKYEKGG